MKLTDLPSRISGDEINLQACPFCGNRNYHIYYNVRKRVFYCFICHATGTYRKLKRELSLTEDLDENLAKDIKDAQPQEDSRGGLPKGFVPCWDGKKLTMPKYLVGRGVRPDTVKRFGIGYIPDGKMCRAVVFPVTSPDGKASYILRYTHRKVYLLPKGEGSRGIYFCPPDSKLDLTLVVEGTFDALAAYQAGLGGLAVFGTAISREQRRRIAYLGSSKKTKNIVVAFDADATDEAEKSACEFASLGIFKRVGLLRLEKDLDEYSSQEVRRKVANEVEWVGARKTPTVPDGKMPHCQN